MKKVTRRDFTKKCVVVGAGSALYSSRVSGANNRINLGVIGCGEQGAKVMKSFLSQPDVNTVAVCDVYEPNLNNAVEITEGKATPLRDFRKLIDNKDVDAVLIATPDHWHAMMTIMACKAGKDVYVETPMTLTVREGRVMVNEARKNKRVVQVGSQQRSGEHYKRAVKLIQEGIIGEVHKVTSGFTRNILVPRLTPKAMKNGLTKELDWDMWLGPAPFVQFDPFRCIYNFRWFWDYSGGQLTGWGAHNLDIARWALNFKGPIEIAGCGNRYALKDGGETPDVQEVVYMFQDCLVTWSGRELNKGSGILLEFIGTKGTLSIDRDNFTVTPEIWDGKPAMEPVKEAGSELDMAHVRNFLDCVKSRGKPNADVEDGHLSAAMCHLGNISTRIGRSIRWDAEKEEVIGDSEAGRFLSKVYRAPWKLI